MRRLLASAVFVASLAACARPPAGAPAAGRRLTVATFTGVADARAGLVTLRPSTPAATSGAVQAIPDGGGSDQTVDLVTVLVTTVPGACDGGSVDAFEGDVELRSSFPTARLMNAHAEILTISTSGRESCKSAPVTLAGTSNVLGLFAYGDVDFKGTPGAVKLARWSFRIPDRTSFTFTGRIVADVYETAGRAPSATQSSLTASPGVVYADGTATAALAVIVRDASGVPLPGRAVTFSVSGAGNSLSAGSGTTGADGRVSVALASSVAEPKTVTAVIDPGPSQLTLTRGVSFVTGPLDDSASTVAASPASAVADGVTPITVTVAVVDTSGGPMSGHDVTLGFSGVGVVTPVSATTDSSGVATFRITAAARTTGTVTATLDPGVDEIVLSGHPTISFYGMNSLGGSVAGVGAAGLVVATPGVASVAIPAGATTFAFDSKLPDGTAFDVYLVSTPAGHRCTVANGSGVAYADVTDILIRCWGWKKVSAGRNHTAAITTGGDLWTWGDNTQGQLGNGTIGGSTAPYQVGTGFVDVAGGGLHTIALKADGSLWAWGWNTYGQLGTGAVSAAVPTPTSIATGFGPGTLGAGDGFSVARKADGSIWSWGANSYSQLGNSGTSNVLLPTRVQSPTTYLSLAAGLQHAIGVRSGNALMGWGANASGQAGGTGSPRTIPGTIGTVTTWSTVAAGNTHSLAIQANGTLWAWGNNGYGQVGDGTTTASYSSPVQVGTETWTAVAGGGSHSLGVKANGSLWGWGSSASGQVGNGGTTTRRSPVAVAAGTAWTAVAAGSSHSVGIRADGSLWAWGDNTYGQLGFPGTAVRTPAELAFGTPVPSRCRVDAPSSAQAGTSQPLTVTVVDALGSPVPGVLVTIEVTGGAVTLTQPGATGSDGHATGYLLATTPGDRTFVGRLPDGGVIGGGMIAFVPGPPSAATSTLVASPLSIYDDGEPVSLTATIVDVCGNPIPGESVLFVAADVTFAQPGDLTDPSGTATGAAWAWTPGVRTISAVVGGVAVATADVSFERTPLSATLSTVAVDRDTVPSDGSVSATVTVVVRDVSGRARSGQTVSLDFTAPASFFPTLAVTDDAGAATFTISGAGVGTGVLTATVNPGTDSLVLAATPSLRCATRRTLAGAVFSLTATGLVLATPGQADLPVPAGATTFTFGDPAYDDDVYTVTAKSLPDGLSCRILNGAGVIDGRDVRDVLVDCSGGWKQVSAGYHHTLGLKVNGELYAWGANTYGQIGDGTATTRPAPVLVGSGFSAVSAGWEFSLALKANGDLYAWGNNPSGQLGDGSLTNRSAPVFIGTGFVSIAAGTSHALGIKANGDLYAWGSNYNGQLGLGTTPSAATPTFVGSGFTVVAAGSSHSVALKTGGDLYAWGWSYYGQVGDGTSSDTTLTPSVTAPVLIGGGFAAIGAGYAHTLAVGVGGDLWAWGFNQGGQIGDGNYGTNVKATTPVHVGDGFRSVAGGSNHSLALTPGGAVYAWGSNSNGQLGDGTMVTRARPLLVGSGYESVAAGSDHSLGITTSGELRGWGRAAEGQLGTGDRASRRAPTLVGSGFSEVAAGKAHSLALASNGAVYAWGANADGAVGNGVTFDQGDPLFLGTGYVSIAAGARHSLALKSDGKLYAWGYNFSGQLGDASTTMRRTPVLVGSGFAAVGAGTAHSLGVKTNGDLYAWGANSLGQLGDGTAANRTQPVLIGVGYAAASAGENHSLAVRTDGSLYGWGSDDYGQVGDGASSTTPGQLVRSSPVLVGHGFSSVTAGSKRSFGLSAQGDLYAWGMNMGGALGDGTSVRLRATPVRIGSGILRASAGFADDSVGVVRPFHSLIVTAGGDLLAWGDNTYGQLGDGTFGGATSPRRVGVGFRSVAAGATHSLAVTTGGDLYAWGSDADGQLGVGNGDVALAPVPIEVLGLQPPSRLGYAPTIAGYDLGIPITANVPSWTGMATSFRITPNLPAGLVLDSSTGVISGTPFEVSPPTSYTVTATGPRGITSTRIVISIAGVPAALEFALEPANVTSGTRLSPVKVAVVDSAGNRVSTAVPISLAISRGSLAGTTTVTSAAGVASFADLSSTSAGIGLQLLADAPGLRQAVSRPFDVALPPEVAGASLSVAPAIVAADGTSAAVATVVIQDQSGIPFAGATVSVAFSGTASISPATALTDPSGVATFSLTSTTAGTGTIAATVDLGSVQFEIPERASLRFEGQHAIGGVVFGLAADGLVLAAAGLPDLAVPRGTSRFTFAAPVSYGTTYLVTVLAQPAGQTCQVLGGTGVMGTGDVLGVVIDCTGTSWAQVSVGERHVLALRPNGDLYAWGSNSSGQLGDGSTVTRPYPVLVGSGYALVAAGAYHSLALTTSGELRAWGANNWGQLGTGTTGGQSAVPVVVGTGYRAIAAGVGHSVAIDDAGQLFAWGCNTDGQLGDGTNTFSGSPLPVGAGFTAIAAGWNHTLALRGGDLYAWGDNSGGQLGDGTTTDANLPVLVGSGFEQIAAGSLHSLAIRWGQDLYAWGYNYDGQLGDGTTTTTSTPKLVGTGFAAVAAGAYHSLAITTGHELHTWGQNTYGQLGDGTLAARNSPVPIGAGIAATSAGRYASLALTVDGALLAWGAAAYGQLADGSRGQREAPARVASGIASVSGGDTHTLAVAPNGDLYTWGANNYGQLGDGTTTSRSTPMRIGTGFAAAAAGRTHSLAVDRAGNLYGWGYNVYGQVGDGSTTQRLDPVLVGTGYVAVAAGFAHSLGLRENGDLYSWGDDSEGQLGSSAPGTRQTAPVRVGGGYASIGAGTYHSLAVTTTGSLYAWGRNASYQLGDGTTTRAVLPKLIMGSGYAAVEGCDVHSLAVKTGGELYAWGANASGQLGDGTTTTRGTPVQVGSGLAAVACGAEYSLGLTTSGDLYAWGKNASGQLGTGATTNSLVPVLIGSGFVNLAAGTVHSLGVLQGGDLYAWGSNPDGRLGDGLSGKRSAPGAVEVFGAPDDLTYAPMTAAYQAGAPITPNEPQWYGIATFFEVSPPLPTGLSLDPFTGVITGTPVTPSPYRSYAVTAHGPGRSTTGLVTLAVE